MRIDSNHIWCFFFVGEEKFDIFMEKAIGRSDIICWIIISYLKGNWIANV
jgi:hypothetical protein